MIDPIAAVQALAPATSIEALDPARSTRPSSGADFKAALDSAIQSVQGAQETASQSVGAMLQGKGGELHSALLATQRAELQFQMFLQLRNKVVNAYQEIMRVQV